jgi:hypothetical protein
MVRLGRGTGDPQDEVWALAHSAEPGAIDNASGVAMCVEIARVIEGLIAEGALPRPRRTIRLLNAYECHGFFKYLEDVRRLQTPLAGVVIDTIGSKPSVCDGRLEWHATIPMSAGFVDRLGASIIRSALRNQNPGYRLCQEPFMPTSDTLIGDPKFGFPCPWITTHHRDTGKGFDAYHTSADQIGLLSGKGLAVCAASMASYLYWLADAGTPEVVDIARVETERSVDRLTARGMTRNQLHFECEQHSTIIEELKRWMWGGNRENTLSILDACRSEVLQTSENRSRRRKPSRQKGKEVDTRIPRRTAILSPISENVSGDISWRIGRSGLSSWALFWADGKRSLTDIAAALSCETGKTVPVRQVAEYFEAHEALDYVRLINRKDMVSRVKLIADLKALGLISGMDVMVHSSLAKIGHVIGGAGYAVLQSPGRAGLQRTNHTHDKWSDSRSVLAKGGCGSKRPSDTRCVRLWPESSGDLQRSHIERSVDGEQSNRSTRARRRIHFIPWSRPQCHDSLSRGRAFSSLWMYSTEGECGSGG